MHNVPLLSVAVDQFTTSDDHSALWLCKSFKQFVCKSSTTFCAPRLRRKRSKRSLTIAERARDAPHHLR